jgi:hypothetical protein
MTTDADAIAVAVLTFACVGVSLWLGGGFGVERPALAWHPRALVRLLL